MEASKRKQVNGILGMENDFSLNEKSTILPTLRISTQRIIQVELSIKGKLKESKALLVSSKLMSVFKLVLQDMHCVWLEIVLMTLDSIMHSNQTSKSVMI